MATTPAFVQVNEGVGKRFSASTYTENSQVVYDQKVILGESYLAHYSVVGSVISTSTSASHLLEIMAGASLNVRIRKILVRQSGASAAVNVATFQVWRLTSAGTGGTVITPSRFDTSDAVAGATAMSLPTVKGTEFTELWEEPAWFGTAATPTANNFMVWVQDDDCKPIIIPAGAANGIAIKIVTGFAAGASVSVELSETSF